VRDNILIGAYLRHAARADALGVATSTVKYRVRQAIELLKSRMAEPKLRI
jgi:DNA-directed RNA polymerase specialized sigma24 family protein